MAKPTNHGGKSFAGLSMFAGSVTRFRPVVKGRKANAPVLELHVGPNCRPDEFGLGQAKRRLQLRR